MSTRSLFVDQFGYREYSDSALDLWERGMGPGLPPPNRSLLLIADDSCLYERTKSQFHSLIACADNNTLNCY